MTVRVTLIGKPDCHLCDEARAVVLAVIADIERDTGAVAELEELSILEDRELRDRYAEEIPVVLVDGAMHTYWEVDPARLRRALTD